MRYLVDTDWAIDHMHANEMVVRRLRALAPDGIGMSIISVAELYEGILYSRDTEAGAIALRELLRWVGVVPIDDEVCRIFARERGRLRQAGTPIGDFDLLIGSTALRHNLTMLTNNRRHFDRIQGLQILSV